MRCSPASKSSPGRRRGSRLQKLLLLSWAQGFGLRMKTQGPLEELRPQGEDLGAAACGGRRETNVLSGLPSWVWVRVFLQVGVCRPAFLEVGGRFTFRA